MPETTRPERVSSYQARIERHLTDIFIDVPATAQAGQEWQLINVGHSQGYAQCELCGHLPIRRLFWIQSASTGAVQMIGSECARNYVRVDLVEAYERSLNRTMNQRRTTRRREAAREERRRIIQERTEQAAQRANTARAEFAASHTDLITWLNANHAGNEFLTSVHTYLESRGYLTDRQIECVQRNIEEEQARAANPRPQNALDRAATPDECPHIYNGTYTMDDGSEHMTFAIYTATRGSLQGKRIVKKMNTYGQFEGFAFVGHEGELVVWRRYAEAASRNERFIVWGQLLLSILNDRTNDAPGIDHITVSGEGTLPMTIQRTRSCRRCNRQLTVPTSIESGIGPECQRRDHERTTAAGHHDQVSVEDMARAAVLLTIPEHEQELARRNRRARAAAVPTDGTQLELSELGSGMVR